MEQAEGFQAFRFHASCGLRGMVWQVFVCKTLKTLALGLFGELVPTPVKSGTTGAYDFVLEDIEAHLKPKA